MRPMRDGGSPLIALDDALARVLAAVKPLSETQTVSTFDGLGRILAQPVASAIDVPSADNAAMDGVALRAADWPSAEVALPVLQRIAAGHPGQPLEAGTAARIFTGAHIPHGADAVVMQEQCVFSDGTVRVLAAPVVGQSIRRRGEDVASGATVLTQGARLTAQALGLAASVGAAELVVARRPRVALLTTGDELAMPGEPLKPGAIYNSNRFMLRGLLQGLGAECVDLGCVPDNLDTTRTLLREAASQCDLIVSSGGVSVGEEDHLRPAVAAQGRIDVWQVAIKPGKPLAFGAVRREAGGEALFLGLPGNPVASFITFLLVVRPVLLRLQGAASIALPRYRVRADFDWPKPDKRREFLRVRRNPEGGVGLFANQGSGVLTSTVWADGLVDNPPGQAIRAGDTVEVISLAEWAA